MVTNTASGAGIVSWGTYLPYWRLQRAAIAAVLGSGPGKGARAVASYDEDTTTLGVEAARRALATAAAPPQDVLFSTPAPGYLDKTSATVVHAALGLERDRGAYDFSGAPRSAVGTVLMALSAAPACRTLAVVSDLRTGLAGGAEERDAGDGGVAFLCGAEGAVAELIGRGAASDEFLDRWRVPGAPDSHVWEERFGEEMYVPLAREAFADALKSAGVTENDVDHAIVAGLHTRAVKAVTAGLGVAKETVAPDLTVSVGNLGAAQAGLALADVFERAVPGQVVVVLSLADGADALVLRTTEALTAAQAARRAAAVPTVAEQVASGRDDLSYAVVLDLARPAVARAAPASGPRAPRRTHRAPLRRLEVRLRRQHLHGLWLPPHAADKGLPVVPGHRFDGGPSAWPTSAAPWPPSPSIIWPTASPHR